MNGEQADTIRSMSVEVHENARAKGFHPAAESEAQYIAQACANIHSEVSEFWEAHRKHQLDEPCDKYGDGCPLACGEEELADILIRVLDTARRLKIDIGRAVAIKHQYNTCRPYRHGGKAA